MAKKSLDYNYAKDKEFAKIIGDNLLEIWNLVQSAREEREERWQEHYRAWSVDRTESDQNYKGMADLIVPQLRKEVETMSRRIYKGLLPEDYLKADPTDIRYDELTNVNTQVVRHYYDNIIKIKQPIYPWIKQGVLLGTSPIRQFWHKETNEMLYKKRLPVVQKDGSIKFKSQEVLENVTLYDAPKLRTEDIFNTWVYPHNANTPEDIEIVFWRTKVTRHELERKAKQGLCIGFDEFKDLGKDKDWEFEESQERLQQFGETGQFLSTQNNGYFDAVEIWCKLVLPGNDVPVSCVVEIIDESYVTRVQRNPYWHQMMPFDFMRYIIPPPGEFYGRGLPEAGISLQHQLNDTMNQTMDSATLRLNNITIINPAYAPNSESFEIEPGATWWADPNAVKQFEFPDLTDSGYKAAATLRGIITEMSDNSPQLPDPIAGKARSTGQAQLAINEWQTDLFTFIDFISTEALSSMAYKTHSLIQQFISEDAIIKIAGKYSGTWLERVVTPQDIVGNYKFKWIGALQIENQAIKTQQMLNLLKIWPTLPPEVQGQVKVNWENYIVKILRDGFLIKDVENIVETSKMKASTPPALENEILRKGGMLQVVSSDDDRIHSAEHDRFLATEKDPYVRAQMSRHKFEHDQQARQKQMAAQLQAQMMQMQTQQPQIPGRPEGNRAQIPEATSQQNMERGMRLES